MTSEPIHFGRPMIGEEERAAVMAVLDSPQLVHGPRAQAFEAAFAAMLGPDCHAASLSSCTAGLHLSYLHLGIGPGDEVIVPAQTHVATAHAVEITGAKPVFVDCDPNTGNIDPAAIARSVTPQTRAISIVHYLGLPVDMLAVLEIAKPRGLFVIEDCALAVGASLDGVACGLMGDLGAFSFYPVKHLTTAEGGMAVSRHADVIASIANLKAFGYDKMLGERKLPGVYDIARLGLNYRMNEIAAAIGAEQVKKAAAFQARRDENAAALRAALSGVDEARLLADGDARFRHANYCLSAVLTGAAAARRPQIMAAMKSRGVGTSVYYPVAVPLSAYYAGKYGWRREQFPNAATLSETSIALPVGPHLSPVDMARIADALTSAIKGQAE